MFLYLKAIYIQLRIHIHIYIISFIIPYIYFMYIYTCMFRAHSIHLNMSNSFVPVYTKDTLGEKVQARDTRVHVTL